MKQVFVFAVALMLLSQLMLTVLIGNFWGIVAMLLLFFIAFNILEASLPSLISKLAPARPRERRWACIIRPSRWGLFVGGVMGGLLSHYVGHLRCLLFGGAVSDYGCGWPPAMKTPPAVQNQDVPSRADVQPKRRANCRATERQDGRDGSGVSMPRKAWLTSRWKWRVGMKNGC